MTNHTPGPWIIDGDRGVICGQTPMDNEYLDVATLAHDFQNEQDCERGAADAALIAAAPDMLSELKRELAWLQHIRPQIQAPSSVMLGFDQAIKSLSATIAKATGVAS